MAASNHFPDVVIGINPDAFDAMRMGLRTALLDSGLFIEQKQPAPIPPTRFERFTSWLWRASYNLSHYPGLIVWAIVSGLMAGRETAREKWQA